MKITRRQLRRFIGKTLSESKHSDFKGYYRAHPSQFKGYDDDSDDGYDAYKDYILTGDESLKRGPGIQRASQPAVRTVERAPRQPITPVDKSSLDKHVTPNYPYSYPADKRVLFADLKSAWDAQGTKDGHDPYFFISDGGDIGVYFGPDVKIGYVSKQEAEEVEAAGAEIIYALDSRGYPGNWSTTYVTKKEPVK